MVANNTMDAHMAASLWTIAAEKKSIVSGAGPQHAGKTTVLFADMEYVPEGTPIHAMSGEIDEIREFANSPDGGYLEVGEISDETPDRYIWEEPVRALFTTLKTGYSLATTMHVSGVEDVFEQICGVCEVPDADAALVEYVVHIARFGQDEETYWRRIDGIYEIRGVESGVPNAVKLFSCNESDDSFVATNSPQMLSASAEILAERAEVIRREAQNSQTGMLTQSN
jgi:type IV secretory pathway ATPase VirB11/archaellum biosynthesis ATPase